LKRKKSERSIIQLHKRQESNWAEGKGGCRNKKKEMNREFYLW
jgi:hypothetical protein